MKKYLPIIVALSVPLVFIVGVVIYVSIFAPSISLNHDFIMTSARFDKTVFVVDNKLQIEEDNFEDHLRIDRAEDIEFWKYNAEEDTFKKITFEEVKKLNLHPGEESPDGVVLEHYYSSSDIAYLFGARSQEGYYIHGEDKGRKRLNIDEQYLQIVGWIIN